MEHSVLSGVSCLPIRRPLSEMKGKHLGKNRKRILSAGEKEQKKKAHSFTAFHCKFRIDKLNQLFHMYKFWPFQFHSLFENILPESEEERV